MTFIKRKIEDAYKKDELVCLCLKKIEWNNRLIGYVKGLHSTDKFSLEIIDEFGEKISVKQVLYSSIKSLEIGGVYNENLQNLNKKKFKKNLSAAMYFSSRQHNLFEKLKTLKNSKVLCTFFFNTEFSIGIVKGVTKEEFVISNIGYDGKKDGVSVFISSMLTKIRTGSNFENRIAFLLKKNL